ncbi:unnamed protein product [Linum trigynum]|uniref:Uncharacterized protein n=1 Tax=Linum trigynum TaxID=586398 RepID=A0AAV2CY11_9ROSI
MLPLPATATLSTTATLPATPSHPSPFSSVHYHPPPLLQPRSGSEHFGQRTNPDSVSLAAAFPTHHQSIYPSASSSAAGAPLHPDDSNLHHGSNRGRIGQFRPRI